MDEITISLDIADRPYKMVVNKEEEHVIRRAAEIINKKLLAYSKNYAFKDKQDLLSMIALQFASNSIRNEESLDFKQSEFLDRLKEIDSKLSAEIDETL